MTDPLLAPYNNQQQTLPEYLMYMDIGNSRLKVWLEHHGVCVFSCSELHLQSPSDLLKGLISQLKQFQIDQVWVSSVLSVYENESVSHTLKQLGIPFHFVKVQRQCAGLTTHYNIDNLGMDRWLQLLGAAQQYSSFCVIGCGTALTIDVVHNNAHLGGYIIPSLYLQRDVLIGQTRQIKINEHPFTSLQIGQSTSDAVHNGILFNLTATLDKVIRDYPETPIILTGGDAEQFHQLLTSPNPLNPKTDMPTFTLLISDLMLIGIKRYVSSTLAS